MKRLAGLTTGAVALVAVAGSALADGMVVRAPAPPPPPPPVVERCASGPWTGFYAGGNLGWAQLNGDFHDRDLFFSERVRFDDDDDAFTIGVQSGYNLQCGNVVFGVESDWNWLDFNEDDNRPGYFVGGDFLPFRRSRTLDWFGTLRGRVGWTNDRVMVYATGGLAYAEGDREWMGFGVIDGVPFFHRDSGDVEWGWVGGGGIEWLWSPNMSFKAEALWIEFEDSSRDRFFAVDGDFVRRRFEHEDELVVVRVGLNWKFGHRAPPPYEPLK